MRKWLALALVCVACVSIAQVPAGPRGFKVGGQKRAWGVGLDLPPALRSALLSLGRTRYSGTRVVTQKQGPNRESHTEFVITDGIRSRVEFPNTSALRGQVIVEDNEHRRHYMPDKNELHILPPRREQAFGRIAQLGKRKFTFTQTPGGMVAGLNTQLVTVSDPKGNVMQRLWIEPNSGLFVKREIYDRTGALQASFEFTQMNLRPRIDASDFNLQPKGVRIITPQIALNGIIKRERFLDVKFPENGGLQLEAAHIMKIGGQAVLVQNYVGSGHRVSLYQLRASVDPAQLGRLARPEVRTYSWQSSGSSFVLVGDVSDAELRELARRLGG